MANRSIMINRMGIFLALAGNTSRSLDWDTSSKNLTGPFLQENRSMIIPGDHRRIKVGKRRLRCGDGL